jgi:molybdopterin/thiamine biosynthesis adenylyltransferase
MVLTDRERSRYSRHLILGGFGEESQLRVKQGSVLIIGAGGLGSPAALYLAAAGVGCLAVVDFDRVDESNLQRQILYGTSQVGQRKVHAAAERLRDLNPLIDVELHEGALSSENALDLFRRYDVIVDGTENFATRYLVNDACSPASRTSLSEYYSGPAITMATRVVRHGAAWHSRPDPSTSRRDEAPQR